MDTVIYFTGHVSSEKVSKLNVKKASLEGRTLAQIKELNLNVMKVFSGAL
jgi:hypothetical protein